MNTMYLGHMLDVSATHDISESRSPSPVNRLNNSRPPPLGPPSSRALRPLMFGSEASSGTVSPPASHSYSRHVRFPVTGSFTAWALSTEIPHTQGSFESTPVSAAQNNPIPSQSLASGPDAAWDPGMPFARGSGGAVPQPALSSQSNSGYPWAPVAPTPWPSPTEEPHMNGDFEPLSQGPFDFYCHSFPQPDRQSPTPRVTRGGAQKPSAPARASQRQILSTSSFSSRSYVSIVPRVPMDEHPPPLIDRASYEQGTQDCATFRSRSATPAIDLNIIQEDPPSGQLYREKRIRSREEISNQKEGMRVLRANGGACVACYKSKKRCGPGDPCPPCSARGRNCVRIIRHHGEIESTGDQPVSASASAQLGFTSDAYVSPSPQPSSSSTQPVSAPARPLFPTMRNETLTSVQKDTLIDPPCPPASTPCFPESMQAMQTETALNEDLPISDRDPLEIYADPFYIDTWESSMLCLDSAYDNSGYTWAGSDGGHIAI